MVLVGDLNGSFSAADVHWRFALIDVPSLLQPQGVSSSSKTLSAPLVEKLRGSWPCVERLLKTPSQHSLAALQSSLSSPPSRQRRSEAVRFLVHPPGRRTRAIGDFL